MSQLAIIESAQKSLEECFMKRMAELEAQIQGGGPAKETVSKVAEEFRTFRELIFSMLGLLRRQINECSKAIDNLETRQRRKALIFVGVPEVERDSCVDTIVHVLQNKLALKDIRPSSIRVCHRLGSPRKDRARPLLVRFSNIDDKAAVWRAKTALKGTSIAVKEFLTRTRQDTFHRARQHFGIRSCWTQDSVIVVKMADGSRLKITTMEELNSLIAKHPKPAQSGPLGAESVHRSTSGVNNKNFRRH